MDLMLSCARAFHNCRVRIVRLMARSRGWLAALTGVLLLGAAPLARAQAPFPAEIDAFIEEMVEKHQFGRPALRRLFGQARVRPSIIRAMTAPRTALPWHEYRPLHVNPARIEAGTAFWQQHAATLARASREHGVPEELIVATIGVETVYGRNLGSFRVLDALTTLAFGY